MAIPTQTIPDIGKADTLEREIRHEEKEIAQMAVGADEMQMIASRVQKQAIEMNNKGDASIEQRLAGIEDRVEENHRQNPPKEALTPREKEEPHGQTAEVKAPADKTASRKKDIKQESVEIQDPEQADRESAFAELKSAELSSSMQQGAVDMRSAMAMRTEAARLIDEGVKQAEKANPFAALNDSIKSAMSSLGDIAKEIKMASGSTYNGATATEDRAVAQALKDAPLVAKTETTSTGRTA